MTLSERLGELITAMGTDYKRIVGWIGGLNSLSTTDKTSLVNAINEVNAKPSGGGGSAIDDGDNGSSTTSTYSAAKITGLNAAQDTVIAQKAVILDTAAVSDTSLTWSARRINDQIEALRTALLGGADSAFDTFKELQDLLAADDTEAAAFATALGQRLRLDGTAQTVSAANATVARASIAAVGTSDIGNPDTDLVALYTAAKQPMT
jgi:hypothetical protein